MIPENSFLLLRSSSSSFLLLGFRVAAAIKSFLLLCLFTRGAFKSLFTVAAGGVVAVGNAILLVFSLA